MLFKNKNILLLLPIVWLWGACTYEVEDVYDKPAAERYKEIREKTQKDLLAAEKGWVMEYFPTADSRGYVLFVKFETTDSVTFAANNSVTSNTYQTAGSRYALSSDAAPVLNFNTYNTIFHKFSDPAPNGYGLEGDFEFFIISEDENFIELKGRKRDTKILLKKYTESISWEEYSVQVNEMNNFLFNPGAPYLYLTADGKSYELTGGSSSIFYITERGMDDVMTELIPFIVTPVGLRLYRPLEIDGKQIQTFKLSDDKNRLVCIDEGVNAEIVGPELISYFFNAIDKQGLKWTLSTGDNGLSPEVKTAYDRVKQAFLDKNSQLSAISYLYSGRNNTDAVYIVNAKNQGGYLYFDKEQIAEGVKYTFKEAFDANGRTFYNTYDGVSDLVKLLSGSFKIEHAASGLNPVTVKLTNTSHPNIWFQTNIQ
ncbi:MAG: DUF4302 domain-containing protein [Candidatus Symbiothrix sp.]|jgi:hypothetical protein|nr:DUF4302 domain-containing protein [Candidatus Symbiothrix sp.]